MSIWDKIVAKLNVEKNSEVCKKVSDELNRIYKECGLNLKSIKEFENEKYNLIKKLNEYTLYLDELYESLKIDNYVNEEIINNFKTNPNLPILNDKIPENFEESIKSYFMEKVESLTKKLRNKESELGVFINNDDFYKEVKDLFLTYLKKEIENLKKYLEKPYEDVQLLIDDRLPIDNILKLYNKLEYQPLISGDLTARLGVINLLSELSNFYNKLKDVLITLEDCNDIQKDSPSKEVAINIIKEAVRGAIKSIIIFFGKVIETSKTIQNENHNIIDQIIEDFVKAKVAVFYISDLTERIENTLNRDDLIKIFIEHSGKEYDQLPQDIKDMIEKTMERNGIPIARIKYLWDNYLKDINFAQFIPKKENAIMVTI